jgi:hypothetical protein
MQHRQHFLRGEELVGDQADKERRSDRADRGGAGDKPICSGEMQSSLAQPGADRDVPASPDEILQEESSGRAWLFICRFMFPFDSASYIGGRFCLEGTTSTFCQTLPCAWLFSMASTRQVER